ARIRSMAATQELLSSGRWQGISLAELVRRELAPYATRDNTEINGPDILLKSEAGQAMAMVLHELTTNAAKYGTLSTENGRVDSVGSAAGRTLTFSSGIRMAGDWWSSCRGFWQTQLWDEHNS